MNAQALFSAINDRGGYDTRHVRFRGDFTLYAVTREDFVFYYLCRTSHGDKDIDRFNVLFENKRFTVERRFSYLGTYYQSRFATDEVLVEARLRGVL